MASTKRYAPVTETSESKKKTKLGIPSKLVVLNPADCALDFDIEGNGLRGSALCDQGFAYCWSGARANVGITRGRYCFSCKVLYNQEVVMEDTPPDQQNLCRIGISRGDEDVGNLGETQHSFGYGGTGKFSNSGRFFDYGGKFGEGDTIVCFVDLESKPASISFSKNGKPIGHASHFDVGSHGVGVVGSSNRKLDWESALFPHVLLKNVIVEMGFSSEDGVIPEEGYKPWSCALGDGNAVFGPVFSSPSECEVMMMVGLPASGKSTWAEKRVKEHPEKRYILLGTNKNLEQMKVPGLLRKYNYAERFEKLIEHATQILNALLPRAAKVPRNYIIDQTNVYKGARKRKLKPFADYRKVAVVVFPTPEELKVRSDKRFKEMGKEVPAEAVEEMLKNYVLPKSKDMVGTDEFFDQVIFTELIRGEAQRCLDEMKYAQSSANNVSPASVSPYSRTSSVQSYDFYTLLTPPPPPPVNVDHQMPGQVNLGSVPQGGRDSFLVFNQTPQLASVPIAYNYSHNNNSGIGGVALGVVTNPYGGYNPHGAYVTYQSPMVGSNVRLPYGDNITGFQAPGELSTHPRPPPFPSYQPPPPMSTPQPPPPISTYRPPPPMSSYPPPPSMSSYPPPPPIIYGHSPYAATPTPTPTYGNVPAIQQPNFTGGYT